jgi:hypothetical protein
VITRRASSGDEVRWVAEGVAFDDDGVDVMKEAVERGARQKLVVEEARATP